ncbi:hypothetical protein [Bradyrhizobium sp. Tv2a-2]|uniref:hypothetical protein n=1 Tax=Bradyrhizobium sp. Tv2a-2 TaxID=113395 RepID=UPI000466883A|nr:hypothetical protein [Bradyrhizobium sp. Tv2a-2]
MFRVLGNILLGFAQLEWTLGKLFARLLWLGSGAMTDRRLDDPVYKKNVHKLIERNRELEEARE